MHIFISPRVELVALKIAIFEKLLCTGIWKKIHFWAELSKKYLSKIVSIKNSLEFNFQQKTQGTHIFISPKMGDVGGAPNICHFLNIL